MGGALFGILAVFALIAAAFTALLAWAGGLTVALMAWFVLVSLLLILIVLVQKPKGGGLSGAFGGGGGGGAQAAFGAQTGYALTIATVTLFVAFLGLGIWLTLDMKPAVAGETPAEVTASEAVEQTLGTASTADGERLEEDGAETTPLTEPAPAGVEGDALDDIESVPAEAVTSPAAEEQTAAPVEAPAPAVQTPADEAEITE